MVNINRLELARKRRRHTGKSLAEAAKISPVTMSRIINRLQAPDDQTVSSLVQALDFPREFFFQDDLDLIEPTAASFRSLTSMTARERDAALSAGSLAYALTDWVKERFNLPATDILDFFPERDPMGAARALRSHWGIGERPIGHMIKLLESKGIRVFSLAENTKAVDAFSLWRDEEPYIFLNTFKTTERSRFDAAHELGHLVLHRHGGPQQGREAELEAHAFASAFLMPEADLRSTVPYVTTLNQLVRAKGRWGVSVAALAHRVHRMGLVSDWQYRTFCIQINKRYGPTEPEGLAPERSMVWQMVLTELWKDRISKSHIAAALHIPHDELENLIFGLAGETAPPPRVERASLKAAPEG